MITILIFCAAVIVEPIQAEGGDNQASPQFFRRLQKICKEHNVALIVEEVQTAFGPNGQFWAHESWDLPSPADMVIFSEKMHIAGFYCQPECEEAQQGYRIVNTWVGDPLRLALLKTTLEVIKQDCFLKVVKKSGKILMEGLKKLRKFEASYDLTRGWHGNFH